MVHAFTDGVLPTNKPLLHFYGIYHAGHEEIAKRATKCLFDMNIPSFTHKAFWKAPESWPKQFKAEPSTLEDFLAYLQTEKDIVQPEVACHAIEEDDGIKQNDELKFEVQKLPARTVLRHCNIGSLLKWDKFCVQDGSEACPPCKLAPGSTQGSGNCLLLAPPCGPVVAPRPCGPCIGGDASALSRPVVGELPSTSAGCTRRRRPSVVFSPTFQRCSSRRLSGCLRERCTRFVEFEGAIE